MISFNMNLMKYENVLEWGGKYYDANDQIWLEREYTKASIHCSDN